MPVNINKLETKVSIMLGTGCGADYKDKQLNELKSRIGKEVSLFRAMCNAEYLSIIENNNTFIDYEWAMEKKWFATSFEDANKWGRIFYPERICKIIEIIVLQESLKYMFFLKFLDNIGPAYSADVELLNKIVRRINLI